MKKLRRDQFYLYNLFVIMTVGGGFAGICQAVEALTIARNGIAEKVITFFGIILYVFILFSGLAFIHNPSKTTPMLIAFAMQVPWVSSPIVGYKLSAGGNLSAGLIGDQFIAFFRFGSEWHFSVLQSSHWGAGINFVALALLLIATLYYQKNEAPLP